MRNYLVLALWVSQFGSAPAVMRGDDLALFGAKIYLSPEGVPIDDGSILIRDGKIQAVGPSRSVSIPTGTMQLDCRNLTVTAGFWNSHVHILTPALLDAKRSSASQLTEELEKMFSRWGFTTVFDISSV